MRRPNAINLLSIVSRHKIPEFCHFKLFFCIRRQKNVRNLLGAYRIIVSLFSDDLVAVFGRRGSLSSLINGNENTSASIQLSQTQELEQGSILYCPCSKSVLSEV